MTSDVEKAESLLRLDYRRIEWAKLSNLSPSERDLVLETHLIAWRGYLNSQGIEIAPRAMTPSQKNAKRSLKEKLASGLNDLSVSAGLLFSPMGQGIRFKQKDLLTIFDSAKVADIVRACALNLGLDQDGNDLGRGFAFAILDGLRDAFPDEDILVVRGLKPLFGLDERKRAFAEQRGRRNVRKGGGKVQ